MEKPQPELSLIIPAYNEAEVIKATLGAINEAIASEFVEILVVCNGCTDNTAEIAKKAGANVLTISDKGAAKASNFGAKRATTDTLLFLDADTIIAKNLLQKVREAVANNYIGGRTVVKWEGKGIMPRLFSLVSYVHPYKYGGFCFVDKSVFESIGGYKEGTYGFDFDLGKRVSRHGKTVFIRDSHVLTSSRRFEDEGWLRHMWLATKRYCIDHIVRGKGVKQYSEIEYKDIR